MTHKQHPQPDRLRIHPNTLADLDRWAKTLGVSRERIAETAISTFLRELPPATIPIRHVNGGRVI